MKTYDNMFCAGEYSRSSIKVNIDALNEYDRLKDYCFFSTINRDAVSDDTLAIFIMNVQSLAKHVNDIIYGYSCLNNFKLDYQILHP